MCRLFIAVATWCFFLLLGVPSAFSQTDNPIAAPEAMVISDHARFTVLTPQLIRMEWSEDGTFEENASLVFLNRRLAVPRFKAGTEEGWVLIRTEKLRLLYKEKSGRFGAENLKIFFTLDGSEFTWHPGMKDTANLGGTIRTLDGVDKPVPLEPGILSRDGWVVVDDSERPLFDKSPWPWVMPRSGRDRQDLYFFGYGHDYKKALHDFTLVAGKIPLPPRFAFGLWWSRYWAYTDKEFKDLVNEFGTHGVPLDVLVIDMDWHQTFDLRWDTDKRDQADQRLGWTGYTWDNNYFPDPTAFLAWCEKKGLKTPLNIHPASGVQPHEEAYPPMARAMGIDPKTQKYVPFDIVDKRFAENYMNIVLRPLERQGVDFWWLDWQAWSTTKIAGVTPTWWLNYVFFTDMERQGRARPLLFHRWGGLGNHRYEIGFSGDAHSNWDVLNFEISFTATASNVGFGYWSHDIGGHIPGPVSPELYTRWIQFGVFSPILRTHTTKNPLAERRIWGYPTEHFNAMREAILLRYSLIPYIYTAARLAYDTGISICRPMYYDYAEDAQAYEFKDQYMFGPDMIAAPIASPVDSMTMNAHKAIWLPPGTWIEWCSGSTLRGPAVIHRSFAFDEIPVYVKEGAIIPMQPEMNNTRQKPLDPLILTLFPGDSGSTSVYEDEGNSSGYKAEEYTRTTVKQSTLRDGTRRVQILPSEGNYSGRVRNRSCEIRLPISWPPESVVCNGRIIPYKREGSTECWNYDGDRLMTVIHLPRSSVKRTVDLRITVSPVLLARSPLLSGVPGTLAKLRRVMGLINGCWPKEWSPEGLVNAAQAGNRIGLNPPAALQELEGLEDKVRSLLRHVDSLNIGHSLMRRAHAQLEQALPSEK